MANPRHPLPTLQETLNDKQPLSARLTILIFLIILISVGILGHQNPKFSNTYINEEGLIQQVSAGFWFIATAWCAVVSFRTRTYTKEWITGTLFFFLLGFRELDGQKWLTGWNIDTLEKYWNPSIPFSQSPKSITGIYASLPIPFKRSPGQVGEGDRLFGCTALCPANFSLAQ